MASPKPIKLTQVSKANYKGTREPQAFVVVGPMPGGGGGGGAVDSVNGQTGEVILDAADVGAAAEVHTHTMAQVDGLGAALDGKAATNHTHSISQVNGLQAALDGKAPTSHTHTIAQVTGLQAELDILDSEMDGKANVEHTHTMAQVDGLTAALNGKSNIGHTHPISDLQTTGTASETTFLRGDGSWAVPAGGGSGAVDSVNGQTGVVVLTNEDIGAAPMVHTHTMGQVDGLGAALDGKAAANHTHTIAQVEGLQGDLDGIGTALEGKADVEHTHTMAQVDGLTAALNGKSNIGHTHTIAQVDSLQDALDGKAALEHTHAISDLVTTGTASETTFLRGDGTWATPAGGGGGAVDSVNGKTGAVTLTAADVGAATTEQGAKADAAAPLNDMQAAILGIYTELGQKATAAQGAKADTAVQPAALDAAIATRATSAQGAKADTAVQPAALDAAIATRATSAQGAKADTAVQPAELTTAINSRAPLGHTHVIADVTGLQAGLNAKIAGQNGATALWIGTQAQLNSVGTRSATTLYAVTD